MAWVIAFDVNETLLDLSALDEPFDALFGKPGLRPQWFALMLQLSFVGGLTGRYVDFSAAQRAALAMLAEREGVPLSPGEADGLVGRMTSLPPHPEVPGALARLARSSLRMVALTNSTQPVAEAQLAYAGIAEHFEMVISADSVKHLKPAPQPYHAVAEAAGVGIGDVRLVAAHAWDISGALSAGCAGGVRRPPGNGAEPAVRSPRGHRS
jgi:2-haloacid dehalogenase